MQQECYSVSTLVCHLEDRVELLIFGKKCIQVSLFGTTRYEVNSTWSAINFGPILQPGRLLGTGLLNGTQE